MDKGLDSPMTSETPVTIAIGTRLTLKIDDIAFGGDGVARMAEFVIFVPFVMLGETVDVEIIEVKKSFARGRLVQVIESSPDRVKPECRYFGDCGGCQYQHVAYDTQLRIKHKQIVDLFQRIGQFENPPVAPVIPCPAPYGYRNRIMVRSQWNKARQALNIGFLRHDNRLTVDVEQCPIAEPALNQQLQQVRANPPPRGGLKVVLRIPPENWDLPPDSFFQNNFFLLPKLVETVRERFQSSGSRFLVDAYCGVGFFALELANVAEQFAGVELDQPAIRAARRNAQTRGITNGEFIAGPTETFLPSLLAKFNATQTTVILDPPRTGCPPSALHVLRDVRPAQILYISCHPATLARDLNALCADKVFKLESIVPLDMFPQTQHVECVADLRRISGNAAAP
jgi:tRNA/tmRNA/rRNA uracil-C5-methylase (TrmA/RlmC/RlmD family)